MAWVYLAFPTATLIAMAMGLGQKPCRMMEVSWGSIHGIPTWETYFEIQIMFVHIGCVKPYYQDSITCQVDWGDHILVDLRHAFLMVQKIPTGFTRFSVKVGRWNPMFLNRTVLKENQPSKRWVFFTREKTVELKIRPAGVGGFTFATSWYGAWCWCTTLLVRGVETGCCHEISWTMYIVQKGTLTSRLST